MSIDVRQSPSGEILELETSLADYGAQATWAIDAVNGDDSNDGSLAHPLRTMAEFNNRMFAQDVRVVMTLFLLTNVTDAPLQLASTRFRSGASLTVQGVITVVATPTITAVTTLETLTAFQLTTTGIVWTSADVGKRIQLPGGQVGWVAEFVDANNVITGAFTASNGATVAPTAVQVTVQTLSAAIAANVQGSATTLVTVVTLRDLAIACNNTQGVFICNGIPMTVYGCKVTNTNAPGSPTYFAQNPLNLTGCFITGAFNYRGQGSIIGTCFVSISLVFFNGFSNVVLGQAFFTNSPLVLQERSLVRLAGRCHWRNTAGPLTVLAGSLMNAQNLISGSVGNTGVGITVGASCGYFYASAGTKPTLTGTSNTQIGNTARTYAQIPYVDLDATLPTAVAGTPAAMVLGNLGNI